MNLVRVVMIYNISSVYYSSGDQTGIGSRLSRRARNAYSVIKNNSIAFSRLVTIALWSAVGYIISIHLYYSLDETSGKDCEDRVTNIVYKEIFKDVQTTQVRSTRLDNISISTWFRLQELTTPITWHWYLKHLITCSESNRL